MEKILSICIPRYKEPWEVCHFIFDSVALQQGINFDDIEVILVNDGDDKLVDDLFAKYPFKVAQYNMSHGGVSACRNFAMDKAVGKYIAFCDCDDMLLHSYAFYLVLDYIKKNDYDYIMTNFAEEQKYDGGGVKIFPHCGDLTFMHGKFYKRAFLIENKIRFNPKLTVHEDAYFNRMVDALSKNKKVVDKSVPPFYLWKWNSNSVARRDGDMFLLKTYLNFLDVRTAIAEEFKKRKIEDHYKDSILYTIINVYYYLQKPECLKKENAEYVLNIKKHFKKYYEKYGKVYKDAPVDTIAQYMAGARYLAVNSGMRIEQQTISQFLTEIVLTNY